jgi:hypothetical protein
MASANHARGYFHCPDENREKNEERRMPTKMKHELLRLKKTKK